MRLDTRPAGVISPGTEFALVRSGTDGGPCGRRCDIVGLRCEMCGAEVDLGERFDHEAGCEQAGVQVKLRGSGSD